MSWLESLDDIRKRDWSSASDDERQARAKDVVEASSFASGAAALVPVPLVDLAILLPVHTTMVMTIGHLYGRTLSKTEAARVVAELGAVVGVTFAGRAALSVLKGLLPGVGGVIAAPAAFAMTFGFGRLAIAYFENPKASREHLRTIFKEAAEEGRRAFSKEALERFRRRHKSASSQDAPEGTDEGSSADVESSRADGATLGVEGDEAEPLASPERDRGPEVGAPRPSSGRRRSEEGADPARSDPAPAARFWQPKGSPPSSASKTEPERPPPRSRKRTM